MIIRKIVLAFANVCLREIPHHVKLCNQSSVVLTKIGWLIRQSQEGVCPVPAFPGSCSENQMVGHFKNSCNQEYCAICLRFNAHTWHEFAGFNKLITVIAAAYYTEH